MSLSAGQSIIGKKNWGIYGFLTFYHNTVNSKKHRIRHSGLWRSRFVLRSHAKRQARFVPCSRCLYFCADIKIKLTHWQFAFYKDVNAILHTERALARHDVTSEVRPLKIPQTKERKHGVYTTTHIPEAPYSQSCFYLKKKIVVKSQKNVSICFYSKFVFTAKISCQTSGRLITWSHCGGFLWVFTPGFSLAPAVLWLVTTGCGRLNPPECQSLSWLNIA